MSTYREAAPIEAIRSHHFSRIPIHRKGDPRTILSVVNVRDFRRHRVHQAIVVDEYGGAVGVVPTEDILEEVIGEIEHEYAAAPDDLIKRRLDVTILAKGRVAVRKVNAEVGLPFPISDEQETVAGLILDRAKRLPKVGEAFRIAGVIFTITRASDRTIDEVRLRKSTIHVEL